MRFKSINNYLNLLIFVIVATLFGTLLYLLNFLIYALKKKRYQNIHTFKTYEFGTTSIGNLQGITNSHFYLLSILFILFDVEIMYIYIWITGLSLCSPFIYKTSFVIFLTVIFFGLFYELINGALIWYKKRSL